MSRQHKAVSEDLRRLDNHRVESGEGWTVDTSRFWFLIYRDPKVEAKAFLEGAGSYSSPCLVGFSTMTIEPFAGSAGRRTARNEIEARICAALDRLKIRYSAV